MMRPRAKVKVTKVERPCRDCDQPIWFFADGRRVIVYEGRGHAMRRHECPKDPRFRNAERIVIGAARSEPIDGADRFRPALAIELPHAMPAPMVERPSVADDPLVRRVRRENRGMTVRTNRMQGRKMTKIDHAAP